MKKIQVKPRMLKCGTKVDIIWLHLGYNFTSAVFKISALESV